VITVIELVGLFYKPVIIVSLVMEGSMTY